MAGSVGQYTQAWFGWVGEKGSSVSPTRQISVADLGQGYVHMAGLQNNYIEWDCYFDSVTWKLALLTNQGNTRGISTVKFDGVSQGTIDLYDAAGGLPNQYDEITGISVTAAGVKTVRFITETKNASSSSYFQLIHSIAFIRTGGTASTPAGTDTPGYTWEWIPWMGAKGGTVTSGERTQRSGSFGGGDRLIGGAVNDDENTDFWQDTGTYSLVSILATNADGGIVTYKRDGTAVGSTIDCYSAGFTANVVTTMTGITNATAGIKNFQYTVLSKNASSSGYFLRHQSLKWIRTGA